MSEHPIPNFFIIGAAKAGTTSLYHHLRQHPDIFMSPEKEPCHFSMETRPENYVPAIRDRVVQQMEGLQARLDGGLMKPQSLGIVSRREDYLRLFARARHEHAIGEASVSYLWSKTAAREIAAFNPMANIVMVLRNPVERAFSHYRYYLGNGHISHSFSEHIAICLRSEGLYDLFNPFLDFGFYGEQVERVLAYFPRSQVKIWLYEDTLHNPDLFFRELLEFLGVDPNFVPDRSHRHLEMAIPRAARATQILQRNGIWNAARGLVPSSLRPSLRKLVYHTRESAPMSDEDRRFLASYYRNDIRKLQSMIQQDLSAWLT